MYQKNSLSAQWKMSQDRIFLLIKKEIHLHYYRQAFTLDQPRELGKGVKATPRRSPLKYIQPTSNTLILTTIQNAGLRADQLNKISNSVATEELITLTKGDTIKPKLSEKYKINVKNKLMTNKNQ